jgi:ubiquinone/menaquinone biosynthesis C-methylase UbiE
MRLPAALRSWLRRVTPEAIPALGARLYVALPGRATQPLQERIAARVDLPGGVIVDLGCGPGLLAAAVARRHPRALLVGVDLSAPMLAVARRQAPAGARVVWVRANAARLPFAGGSVDLLVSVESLHHWRRPAAAINEIHRCLRPGGSVWIFDGYREAADADLIRALPRLRSAAARRIARAIMSVHGFSEEEYRGRVRTWFERSRFGGCRMEPDLIWMRIEAHRE